MTPKQYGYAAGWLALALMAVLLIVGIIRNPTQAARREFERQLAEASAGGIDIDFAPDPEFETWQRNVSGRANVWGPLVPPQKVEAPPPLLQEMLKGVEPTRNKIGSGPTVKVQIRVDGKKDFYAVGDQIRGCTIKEITESDVLFTLLKDGKTYGYQLPRR